MVVPVSGSDRLKAARVVRLGRGGTRGREGMGWGCRTRKGKLGNSEKGVRLTLFPFEEAEPGREATARRRWEGHCQGLLWGGVGCVSAGLVRWGTRAGWREVTRLSGRHREEFGFSPSAHLAGRMDAGQSLMSFQLDAWRQKSHRKASAGRPETLPQKTAPFSGACDQGSSPRWAHALVMLPADEVTGCVTSCRCPWGSRPQNWASL